MLRRLPRLLLPRRHTPRAVLLTVLGHWRPARAGHVTSRSAARRDPGRLAVTPCTTTWPGISGATPSSPVRATAARLAPPSSRRQRLIAAWRALRQP